MSKTISLIQIDGTLPNLALMKLSTWHKRQFDKILPLNQAGGDLTYISCIFPKNKSQALSIAKLWNGMAGGSGIDLHSHLPPAVEHIMPDYELYGIDYSMGFLTRGCIRKCPFCIVPEKEGPICMNAPLYEFLDPNHKKLLLLDNNLLGHPLHLKLLEELNKLQLKVNFNQGLDIRLINEDNSKVLSTIKYYSHNFKTRGLHFAFDNIKLKDIILSKVDILKSAGIPMTHCMFYILIGFDSTHEEDMDRIKIVRDIGAIPYIMKYNQIKEPELNKVTRWINRRYYQMMDYDKFDYKKSCGGKYNEHKTSE